VEKVARFQYSEGMISTDFDVPKVRFSEPERNLPGRRVRVPTAETRFTIRFARAYLSQFEALHHGTERNEIACARQVAMNGLGIADLVTVAWKTVGMRSDADDFIRTMSPTVRAFEIKLVDWRRGMTQAHRYRYFANAAILVLPRDKCEAAKAHIETFQRIRVGLWAFDSERGRIIPLHTPRPASAIEDKHRRKALQVIAAASRALPVL